MIKNIIITFFIWIFNISINISYLSSNFGHNDLPDSPLDDSKLVSLCKLRYSAGSQW